MTCLNNVKVFDKDATDTLKGFSSYTNVSLFQSPQSYIEI
jgi:hypothetical protein